MTSIPAHPRRVLLVNPTRYLGNLLLAGGLIQDYLAYCRTHGAELRVVVDAAFRDLLLEALPAEVLLSYPRKAIAQASLLGKCRLYGGVLRTLRDFRADLAFNIEEDSVSHRLTQLSGAAFRLGCSPTCHRIGYEQVLPIEFVKRPAGSEHRWHSFAEVFSAVGLAKREPHYLQFPPVPQPLVVRDKLAALSANPEQGYVVLHAGATKDYKRWPLSHFAALATQLVAAGHQVLFIGSGQDAAQTAEILGQLPAGVRERVFDACNQFSLVELRHVLAAARCMVGNDSGPFHLASALGVPGAVIFGPTDVKLWGPLSPHSHVMRGSTPCGSDCTRQHCNLQRRCLASVTPEAIMADLQRALRSTG